MNKKTPARQPVKRIAIKPWYFLAIAVVSGVICVVALRGNYAHMVTLRQAVYDADKRGSGVQTALQDLQAYVTHHMNTQLSTGSNSVYPPIQLKYTYDRLVQAHSEQIVEHNSQNSPVYQAAVAHCGGAIYHSDANIQCIQNYVNAHGTKTSLSIPTIPDSLYKFDFVSPKWSPDMAGWSLLVAVVSLLLAGASWLLNRRFV